MNWYENVLDKSAHKAARRLSAVLGGDFYLAGGTGLALRLGHRISLDLDLFSQNRRLDTPERLALVKALKASGSTEVMGEKDGTIHLKLGGTSVSLFNYPYKLLKQPSRWSGLNVASLEDIAAMKLSAVVGRGAKKDFIDLFFICRECGPAKVLKWGERKFPDHPQFAVQAAKALVYFEDAEKEPSPRVLLSVPWKEIRRYFEKEIPKLFR